MAQGIKMGRCYLERPYIVYMVELQHENVTKKIDCYFMMTPNIFTKESSSSVAFKYRI